MYFIKKNESKKKYLFLRYISIVFFLFLFGIFSCVYIHFFLLKTTKEIKISLSRGASLDNVAEILKDHELGISKNLLKMYMYYKNIIPKSGDYLFGKGLSLNKIMERIDSANYGDVYRKITIPEGFSNKQIISLLEESDFSFNEVLLEDLMQGKEGNFFPDTYSFLPSVSERELLSFLEKTFLEKKEKAFSKKNINKNNKELVIMASILEKEAGKSLEEKQIISGILWKRIEKGMLLQVDAPFLYERNKGSAQLSYYDLRKDSLYNTYTRKGLPPTAIGNPGYDALYAAAHSKKTDYLFYLHDKKGNIHYGKNYQEHLVNKRKYIR